MNTKYTTGQAVLIPAVIESAREENGTIIYDVQVDPWRGFPEDAIIVDQAAGARAAYDKAMSQLSKEINDRFY